MIRYAWLLRPTCDNCYADKGHAWVLPTATSHTP